MRHLDEAELVRYVDGEHPPDEALRWRRHVDTCAACRREVADIRAESALFSGWLDRADFEADLSPAPPLATAPAAGSRGAPGTGVAAQTSRNGRPVRAARRLAASPWLKAAVIVLLVAAPLAAFPGVRAWVSRVAGGGEAAVEAPVEAVSGPVIRFQPTAGSFTVRIDGPPLGTLTLERAEGTEAVLRIAGDAEPVVSAGLLRIRAGQTGAEYRLTLPAIVADVRVELGERAIRVTGPEVDAGRTIPLGEPTGG